ncbi:KAP family P-loop NTPase fold protein [Methanococcoides methylutens]|uniref:KAP family P-loop NTPase fold protein n=1 Tax=Methanococcoides methylutens TaxID=2226 RepID=UPI000693263B|nr:P-loop NTPase fold protein [Methanococcoides methylutens]
MINPDKPIKSSDDDALGRKGVAKALGDALLVDSSKECHVIGIYGKWGSGKTSFINMALEHVEEKASNLDNNEKPIIINFNPWNFSNQNQLIEQFFKQLSNTFEKVDYSVLLKTAGKLLRTYSKIISPLSYVPGISAFASITSTASEAVADGTDAASNYLEKGLEETKEEISKNLRELDARIIVVIDDIDRLNKVEIRQIFQLVKSIADFPNTTYILTFDREVVAKALVAEQCGNGNQYLEKIIQVPFELPDYSMQEYETLLFEQLDKIIKSNPHVDFDRVYWGNVYHSGFKYFFKNIRDINRYINVLTFNYEIIKEEVNVIDFIAITAIQVFLPEVYHGIKSNKHVFAGIMLRQAESQRDVHKRICDEIIEETDDESKKFLKEYMTVLFPKITSLYEIHSHDGSFLDRWRKNRRVCSDDVFDRYFKFALSEGKLSQSEINTLCNTDDVAEISKFIEEIIEDNKLLDFLKVFPDYTDKIPADNIESLVNAIMEVGDSFPEDESIFYGTSLKIHWIISSLLEQIETQEERFNILERSINNTHNSLYTFVWEIDLQNEKHGKYDYKEPDIPEEQQLINLEQLQRLEKLACDKIRRWAENGTLIESTHIYTILILWKQWNSDYPHEEFMQNIVSNDVALPKLIASMMTKSYSHTITNYLSEVTDKINVDALKEITGLDNIKERIILIKESSNYILLNKKEKHALEVCLEEIGKMSKPTPDYEE